MNSIPTPSPTDAPPTMQLRFDASLPTVEGILAMVQEWCSEQGVSRDDGLSVRLVLEELLTNLCLHTQLPSHKGKVDLLLKVHLPSFARLPERRLRPRNSQGSVHITLRDAGPPFNPLVHTAGPRTGPDAPPGGNGLTLVRLIAASMDYQRTRDGNVLSLIVPLNYGADGDNVLPHKVKTRSRNLRKRVRDLWFGNLALRQTVLFTLCSMLLIWGAMGLYLYEISRQRHESALVLAQQGMRTQAVITSTFMQRVADSLEQVAKVARDLQNTATLSDDAQGLQSNAPLSHPDALAQALRQNAAHRSLLAEIPVLGIVLGYKDKAWLYHQVDGELQQQELTKNLLPLVAQNGRAPSWQSLFMNFLPGDPHAAMIYALAVMPSNRAEDGWIGTIVTMPWVAETLHGLSGFKKAVPFFTDSEGRYVIFPSGRSLGRGPQSLGQEAEAAQAPGLVRLEKDMLAGNKNIVQLRPLLHGDVTPWNLTWTGPTTLAYHPMMLPGWHLGLLISSEELGDAPQAIPAALFLMAVLGPLCVGLTTWVVTSRTLRPLNELARALEGFGEGNMDAPFPKARCPDEIGDILTTFERVRVTLRASLRNMVNSAASQQRMQNELSLARSIQESMLPATFPRLGWVDVDARIDMSREVCGDLYDCFLPPGQPERLCCVVGDVCGKGVPAAIIMSRSMSLAHSFLQEGHSPAQTLEKLNTALLRSDNSSMFVTMLVGILDTDGLFQWASAGHPPPITGPEFTDNGSVPSPAVIPWPGELVLGVRKEQRYSTFTTRLTPGQSLLLYTDGADEAMSQPPDQPDDASVSPTSARQGSEWIGEMYGEARLAASLANACDTSQSSQEIIDHVRQDIIRHIGGLSPADDISLMVLTYRGAAKC